ncbi:hypothetical protein SDC9_127482 [bioreactor metagenome]|uniref:Uncharacterized protein n=1 Tax=bioreactor metagenome TaxID=1076179 RepID=A0A645CU74_9ZZZZ
MKKILSTLFALTLTALLLAGCYGLDVILRDGPKSLDAIVSANPALVSAPTSDNPYFALSVDETTKLLVSKDFSLSTEDVLFETPLKPFVDAGLDVSKLPAGYRADAENLYLTADFGSGKGEKSSLTDALMASATFDRSVLGYHAALDHYGVALPGGKFEWAKDYATNDKDIVFVLAATPLADLGVDVQNIAGWVFMTMQDDAGKDFDVLLKPYSLEP